MSSEEAKKKKPTGAEPTKKTTAEETKKKPTEEAKKKPTAEEAPKKPAAAEAPRKPAAEEAKKKKKKKAIRVSSYYKTADGGVVQRKLRPCPRCGPGTFLAEHYDRISCGKCGYAEFRRKST